MPATRKTTDVRVEDEIELGIDSIVAGGDGFGRFEGLAVFVPFTAPGDKARVVVTSVEKRHARARLAAIVEPSKDRTNPRCRHFGTCGGCRLQHVTHGAQQNAKARIVRAALLRIGGIAWEQPIEISTAAGYGERTRAGLRIERAGNGAPLVGYSRAGSHELCAIEECPILAPELETLALELSDERTTIPSAARRAHIALGDDGTSIVLCDEDDRDLGSAYDRRTVRARIAEIDFDLDTHGFFQGHRTLVHALVRAATGDAHGALALDLYAGAGLFSLPLARGFERVIGVESSSSAAERARSNATANGIVNARFECADVSRFLEDAPSALRPDLVVLDPPRRGAGARVVDAISARAPREIRYVSCDPATLARDLARFAQAGYPLHSILALDMFPQTAHIECVATLRALS